MARKMRIGLDLDGVVYPWSPSVRETLTAHLGYHDIGESTHWDYIKDAISPEDWKWLWSDAGVRLMFGSEKAYPGAGALIEACNQHTIIVLTHRPLLAASMTYRWLGLHGVNAQQVHIMGSDSAKSSIKPECDIYIDDKPEVCDDLLENTSAHVFMPNRDWNDDRCTNGKYYPAPQNLWRFYRYDNPKEVVEWLASPELTTTR